MTRLLSALIVALTLFAGVPACGGDTPPPSPSPSPVTAVPTATPPDSAYDVRDYGARGDGTTDDSAALTAAVAAAATDGGLVYLPAGTYPYPGNDGLDLPDGVKLRGESAATSWLKGRLNFGSRSRISELKIGDVGTCAVTNAADARGTTFSRCRLHGGGSSEGVNSSVLYLGGSQGNVSDVVFLDCEIERTSYQPPAGLDAYAANVGNTITIHEFTHLPDSGHVDGITFRDCHLGASNGTDTGALRMMMEAYSWDGRTGRAYHGWQDLTFDGCTIEASDGTALDFADGTLTDAGERSARGALVTGCTFLGARKDDAFGHGGTTIVYEGPSDIVIKKNLFYAVPQNVIGGSHVLEGKDSPGLLIQGNTFDMTKSPTGLKHEREQACINLVGYDSRVVDNTFIYDAGMGVLINGGGGNTVFAAVGNLISDNTFTDTRSGGGEPTIVLTDDYGLGCHDNRITANTITNRGAGDAGVISQTSGTGTNYATDNLIYCGSSLPFVVLSGRIVQKGNRIEDGR